MIPDSKSLSANSKNSSQEAENPSLDFNPVRNETADYTLKKKGPAMAAQEMTASDAHENSDGMPSTVPNFLVKTYKIVNVSHQHIVL